MSIQVERCQRCGKRFRGHGDWIDVRIAGLIVGRLCPDCQTPEESLGVEIDLVLDPPFQIHTLSPSDDDYLLRLVAVLIRAYPTPEVMRDKANQLADARSDASEIVRLMRRLADDMESGELQIDNA